MLYGAAYYHEYQPYERLADDVRLMQEAGISVVRLGESTWSSWEPEDGRFELAWMDRILDALHAADIKVVFGTPTYAVPPWLHRKYPEIMAQHAKGTKDWYGARQNLDLTHPAYLFHCERVIRALASHFAGHPAIIGWQVDNETSSGPLFNHGAFDRFVEYLKAKFGSVEKINEIWGLTYWSHRLSDWRDLWTPDGNTNPGYDLEWRRFQTSLVTEFLAWQTGILREYARPDQRIMQDCVGNHNRAENDIFQVGEVTDIIGLNPYHPTQDGLLLNGGTGLPLPEWMAPMRPGQWSLNFNGDFGRSGKQANFWITEVNAGSIGVSHTNYPSYDGQWRSAVYTFIAKGAEMVEYWHWHTLHYGGEQYWGGVLGHDLEPNRCYREVSQIAHELRRHDALLTGLTPDADVAFLYSQDSKYALEYQPCLSLPDKPDPDRQSYQHIFDRFYRSFYEARANTAIVHPPQDFEQYPVVVAPALYVADEALLDRLVAYVRDGGHLLLTFRSGYADEHGRSRWQRAPGPLREAVGASYQEYSNLAQPLNLTGGSVDFPLPDDARAEAWADGLLLEGATTLASYEHPHFGRFPAIVSQPFGQGRVTYCGTLPNPALGKALAAWVMQQAGIESPFAALPESVRINSAQAASGERLSFFTNWSWETQNLTGLPVSGRQLLRGGTADGTLTLGAWETEIIVG